MEVPGKTQTAAGRWEKISEVFSAAVRLAPSEWPDLLDRLCGHDSALRAEVESLLAAERRAGGFLEGSATALARGSDASSGAEPHHARAPLLLPDEVLSDRYRVVRFIAQGGMGEVYEVEDLELRGRVALKALRPEIADNAMAIERFKREIHLAHRLTHPNVCRTFDLGRHRRVPLAGSGSRATEITFLTMELLPGETLAERLENSGRMTTAQALPLVRQMTTALTAAHAAGIVHRDFKPGNVMLVSAADGSERAVVTDLGLARACVSVDDPSASISGIGDLVGTPAFMSPEQITGGDLTASSDIYSLGVVLYKMVTGGVPFDNASAFVTAVRRMSEPPSSPRTLVPELDRRWEAVILRCLERDPADRYASVPEVMQALEGEAIAPARRNRRRLAWYAAAAGLLAGAVALWLSQPWLFQPGPSPGSGGPVAATAPATTVAPRTVVAIWGFRNAAGRPQMAWVSTAFAEMLTTELAAGEQLRVITGDRIAQTRIEVSQAEAATLAPATLARLRTSLGADVVVRGSYLALDESGGDNIRFDVRIEDVASGEILGVWSGTGAQAQIGDLAASLGARLRRQLGIAQLSAAEVEAVRAVLPANPEAARLYAEGLAKLRAYDALAAKERLLQAVAADPGNPLIRSALAKAWSVLGYDLKAQAEAKTALEQSASLAREQRLIVEATYLEMNQEWAKAVELWQSLWTFFPDDIDYGLRLAAAQTRADKGNDALATVAALQRLPLPVRDDPRIDLAEAGAAESLSDFKRSWAAAERSAEKASRQEAPLLLARARHFQGKALYSTGELTTATAAYSQAKALYAAEGDRIGVVTALNGNAIILQSQGDSAGAKALYGQILPIQREIGFQRGVAVTLNNLANVLFDEGNLAGAKKLYEESLAASRAIGARSMEAMRLTNIAAVVMLQGDLAAARRMFEESLAICRETGDRSGMAVALSNLGEVISMQGTLAAGDLSAARKTYEQALVIRTEIGDKGGATLTQLGLANLSIEEGQAGNAEPSARQAAEAFRAEGRLDDEAFAYAVLAKSLQAQGKLSQARKAINRAAAVSAKSGSPESRVNVAIVAARVHAASGTPTDTAAALDSLQAAFAEARRIGHVPLQFEAWLALGEIEIQSGRASAGRARLEALERDASAKSFRLIASKAAAAHRLRAP